MSLELASSIGVCMVLCSCVCISNTCPRCLVVFPNSGSLVVAASHALARFGGRSPSPNHTRSVVVQCFYDFKCGQVSNKPSAWKCLEFELCVLSSASWMQEAGIRLSETVVRADEKLTWTCVTLQHLSMVACILQGATLRATMSKLRPPLCA
jgi:hypothetical protein